MGGGGGYDKHLLEFVEIPEGGRCLINSVEVFRYSFSESIPVFFSCFKSDFILV